jgi:hypothetical protein
MGQSSCKICEAGKICNNGTKLSCPSGYMCPHERMTQPILCPNRYYCRGGAPNATLCPSGAYCPIGTGDPIPCPGGLSCPLNGTDIPGQPCQAGIYCPMGTINPINCPRGNYCPPFSSAPIPCPLGTYCPNVTMSNPFLCPPGTYGDTIYLIESCVSCLAGTYQPFSEQVKPPPPVGKLLF